MRFTQDEEYLHEVMRSCIHIQTHLFVPARSSPKRRLTGLCCWCVTGTFWLLLLVLYVGEYISTVKMFVYSDGGRIAKSHRL